MSGDRTQQATPHRREKARRDGDVLRSRELTSAAGTLAGVLCLGALGPRIVEGFRSVLAAALNECTKNGWREGAVRDSVLSLRQPFLVASVPVFLAMAAIVGATVMCGVAQSGGLQVNEKAFGFK